MQIVKWIVAALLFVSLYTSLKSQSTYYPLEFTTLRNPAPGYYFIAPNSFDSLGVLDHGGSVIHSFAARLPVNFMWQTDNTATFLTEERKFFKMNSGFVAIDTLSMTDYDLDFHECRVLSNGNTVIFGYDVRTMDLSTVVSGGKVNAKVIGTIIREITPAGDIVFEWSSFDHVALEDATEDIDFTQPTVDYIHPNSICEDADGSFLLSCRHFDAVLKIDRATGAVLWWLGGEKARRNDFTFTNDDINGFTGFSHQHSVMRTSNGSLLMYDNGNLRPAQFSRAVMYNVDQQNMTVTKMWEYRQTPDVFASAMGSVQELINGNILIGWGSSNTRTIATEIGPDGVVEAEIKSLQPDQVRSYRVMKAPFSMTGVEKYLDAPGTIDMATPDSSAHLSVKATALTSATSVIVERHWNTLSSQTYTGSQPCLVLPARWSVRTNKSNSITGSLTFKLGSVPGIDVPDLVKLFHRPTEGKGAFNAVNGTYDAATQNFTTTSFKTGEYVAVYELCTVPYHIAPSNGSGGLAQDQLHLRWSPAVQTLGYQLQVSTSPVFATFLTDLTLNNEEHTLRNLPSFTRYYWRVRTKHASGYGQWSQVWSFRTKLGTPGPIAPRTDLDTVSVVTIPMLTWQAVGNATSYHVRLYRASAPSVIIAQDTVLTTGWSTPVLDGNTWYSWSVRALTDTASGAFSTTVRFLTSPPVVSLRWPSVDERNVSSSDARLVWSKVEGATHYNVRVLLDSGTVVLADQMVSDTTKMLPVLAANTSVRWTVRAIGKYGPGLFAPERTFRTAPEGVLGTPTLVSPEDQAVLSRDAVELQWSLLDATMFTVEVAASETFDTIVHAAPSITVLSYSVPIDVIEAGRTYFWRVRGRTASLMSAYSSVRSFTITAAPPQPVLGMIPLEPVNGAVGVGLKGTFRWTRDSRVDEYTVILQKEQSQVPVRTFTTGDTVVSFEGLDRQTSYHWHVQGSKLGAVIDTGDVASFVTESIISHVDEEASPGVSGSIEGSASCDDGTAQVMAVDIRGRLIDQASIPIDHGHWTYRPTAHRGTMVVCVTVCGKRSSYLLH